MSLLTVLIPTLVERRSKLENLMKILKPQCDEYNVTILTFEDNRERTTGAKRNWLINKVKTEYACFIDDDDEVSLNYMQLVHEGLIKDVDGVGFKGVLLINGKHDSDFIHSRNYSYTTQTKGKAVKTHYRPLNHLNPMRTVYFKAIPFPDITIGEDTTFCLKLQELNLVQTEHFVDEYIYKYRPAMQNK